MSNGQMSNMIIGDHSSYSFQAVNNMLLFSAKQCTHLPFQLQNTTTTL